jgi:DNA helicase IV
VVLVEPAAIVDGEPDRLTGLRRLYVCLTRAVTSLVVLHDEDLPAELDGPGD